MNIVSLILLFRSFIETLFNSLAEFNSVYTV